MTKIVDQAKTLLITGENGISTRIQNFKSAHTNWESKPQTKEFINALSALEQSLIKLLDLMDARINICETLNLNQRVARLGDTLNEMKEIILSLQELERNMAALKIAGDVNNPDDLLQSAREECDEFIKTFLEHKIQKPGSENPTDQVTMFNALISALDLNGALKLSGGAWLVGLGKQKDEVFAEAERAYLRDFGSSDRILTLFQVLLPELMTKEGKEKLDTDAIRLAVGHEKYRDEIKNGVFKNTSKNIIAAANTNSNSSSSSPASPVSTASSNANANANYYTNLAFGIGNTFTLGGLAFLTNLVFNQQDSSSNNEQSEQLRIEKAQQEKKLNALLLIKNQSTTYEDLLSNIELAKEKPELANEKSALEEVIARMSNLPNFEDIPEDSAQGLKNETMDYIISCIDPKNEKSIDKLTSEYKTEVARILTALKPQSRAAVATFVGGIIGAVIGFLIGFAITGGFDLGATASAAAYEGSIIGSTIVGSLFCAYYGAGSQENRCKKIDTVKSSFENNADQISESVKKMKV